jgi:anti-sigma factor RsiW
MNCNLVEEHILDLAAGNAPSAEVEQHLSTCSGCAGRVAELRSTMSLLDEWQAPEPSPYFDTRLKARIREEAAKPQRAGLLAWFRRPVIALAAAGLMALGVVAIRVAEQPSHPTVTAQASAVKDLQTLGEDEDMFAEFDILDDGVQNQTQPSSSNF